MDWRTRVDGFRQMIPEDVEYVLEVGCNRGHNLVALSTFLHSPNLWGAEPAEYPRRQANLRNMVCSCSIYDIGNRHTDSHDLVFTCGVLTHVPPDRLDEALTNVYDATLTYILAIEYEGNDEAIDYRGHTDMLWKRDYGQHYQRLFPDLELLATGEAPAGFDRSTYWLLEK